MVRIGRTLEVRLMARVARRRSRSVVVVCMALDALQGRVRSGQRIVRIGRMVEVDARPVRRAVACVASCRKRSSSVARIGCALPIRLMAAVARRRQSRVVVVRVALCARHSRMRPGQREYRSMIEGGRRPVCRRVAERAVRGKSCRNVRGIVGAGEVSLVTSVAGRRQRRVVVVHMALRALNGSMRAGKREARFVVIEIRQRPRSRVVALRAVSRKPSRRVRRIVRRLVVGLMASVARCRQRCVVVVHVTLGTLHCSVRTGQRECRAAVIERRRLPAARGVANGAVCRESR